MLALTLKYGERVFLQTKDGVVTIEMGVGKTDRAILRFDAPKSIGIYREGYVAKPTVKA